MRRHSFRGSDPWPLLSCPSPSLTLGGRYCFVCVDTLLVNQNTQCWREDLRPKTSKTQPSMEVSEDEPKLGGWWRFDSGLGTAAEEVHEW